MSTDTPKWGQSDDHQPSALAGDSSGEPASAPVVATAEQEAVATDAEAAGVACENDATAADAEATDVSQSTQPDVAVALTALREAAQGVRGDESESADHVVKNEVPDSVRCEVSGGTHHDAPGAADVVSVESLDTAITEQQSAEAKPANDAGEQTYAPTDGTAIEEAQPTGVHPIETDPSGTPGGVPPLHPAFGGDEPFVWESTGADQVDQALAELEGIAQLPLTEHGAAYDRSHRRLQEILSEVESESDQPAGTP